MNDVEADIKGKSDAQLLSIAKKVKAEYESNEKTIILGNIPFFVGGRYGDGSRLYRILFIPSMDFTADADKLCRVGYPFADFSYGVWVLRGADCQLDTFRSVCLFRREG